MRFKPLDQMWERVDVARDESDTALFWNLLFTGEVVTKSVTAGLVAAIGNDRDRHRYRQMHRLVRADGIGDWSAVIDNVLVGPAAQHLLPAAWDAQKELTQRVESNTWQYEANLLLLRCLQAVDPTVDDLPPKSYGRRWFELFASLRNKTRGHGATRGSLCSAVCPDLEQSIRLVAENYSLFQRPWAYLHRNLSGKYRVTKLTGNADAFDPLKNIRSVGINLEDGIYVQYEQHDKLPCRVELIVSDVDAADFFFPNGAFTENRFELLSYFTDTRRDGDSSRYLVPADELPASETQGLGQLDIQDRCFTNLPPLPSGYIDRLTLADELHKLLIDERHPVITVAGWGGIGKTSLALSVLHQLTKQDRFSAIIWFSARDIDLLAEGPKLVKPHVLTEAEIARELVRLMEPQEARGKGFQPVAYLQSALQKGPVGPTLFVLDNFETVTNPGELFIWLDTFIRLPNKILITTRQHDFKGDYPVEVQGMTEQESASLMNVTASSLGISGFLTDKYRKEVYQESSGHPYVIKILLGEVANAGRLVKVERIAASREEILNALFERTFSTLSPTAKRVFLTLSNWRSTVPSLALEAVLLRPANDRMDVTAALAELRRSSFVEVTRSQRDGTDFLSVPLVASVFGRRKLAASAMKSAVEADTELLRAFGAGQPSDIQHGVHPRVERLFHNVAAKVSGSKERLADHLPMLEFIASGYPPAWLLLASLHEECSTDDALEKTKEAIRRYLESTPKGVYQRDAWRRLADLSQRTSNWVSEVHALLEISELPLAPFSDISNAANRLNTLLRQQRLQMDAEASPILGAKIFDDSEKVIVVRRLQEVMEDRIAEGNATDCSRLAWLCLTLHDTDRALKYTQQGLQIDPDNEYCRKLEARLSAESTFAES